MAKQAQSKKIILQLSVARTNERGPLAFEQMLASLHGLLSKAAKKYGDESIVFEMVRRQGQIYFYVVVPTHLRTLITSQFYAQYPSGDVQEVKEYLTKGLLRNRQALIATLRPQEPAVFPFKRHPQFEDRNSELGFEDPLGAIATAMSHVHNKEDSVVVQFVVKPIAPKWNAAARNTLRRFFKPGIWQTDFFRKHYERARLDHERSKRVWKSVIWAPLLMLFGWGKIEDPASNGNNDDREEQQLDRESQTSSRHDRETVFSASYDKLSRLCFGVNIRFLYFHSDPDPLHAEAKIREMAGTFQQFSLPQMNHFGISSLSRHTDGEVFRNVALRKNNRPFALSQEELATMFHLPTSGVTAPGIHWVGSQRLEPPTDLPGEEDKDITLIGQTNFRNENKKYGIGPIDRRRHVYIIGKTGMGKSTLLENMIFSDIKAGKGVAVIDPHGDLAEATLKFIPKNRTNDVIVFDPSDTDFPLAFNMLEGKNEEQRALIASGLLGVIKKLNIDSWGPRLEHFLRNTILALVEAPDTTMLGITRMLVDKEYRTKILKYVKDPMVRAFWETEFNALAPQKLAEAVGPIQNKVGQFLSAPTIRNIVGQPKSTLDLRFAMDSGKIVIVNLSKGKIGEDNSSMLGSLLITKFQLDAMSRADTPEKDRRDFYLYVDEFQNFATDSFSTILSEARKYKLNLTMANQYVAQMSEEVAAAVFGNVGSLVSFQIGIDDAKVFSQQFDEDRIAPIDLASLPKYEVYNRIMLNGMTTPVFSGATLPPPELPSGEDVDERMEKIIKFSRQRYAKPRDVVEDKIIRWTRPETNKKQQQKEASPKDDKKKKEGGKEKG